MSRFISGLTSGAALVTFLVAPHIQRRATPLLWADAVGLAVFSVLGAQHGARRRRRPGGGRADGQR